MNSEIDSSEAKAAGEGLFDDLTSFASTAGASDLGGVGDSSTTLNATDGLKSMPSKEQKFENRSSNENRWKNPTSFNWAFTTGERINLDCKPYNVDINSTTTCQKKSSIVLN